MVVLGLLLPRPTLAWGPFLPSPFPEKALPPIPVHCLSLWIFPPFPSAKPTANLFPYITARAIKKWMLIIAEVPYSFLFLSHTKEATHVLAKKSFLNRAGRILCCTLPLHFCWGTGSKVLLQYNGGGGGATRCSFALFELQLEMSHGQKKKRKETFSVLWEIAL